jgi:HSP20 family protein
MKTRTETMPAKKEETLFARWSPIRMFDELREEMEGLWRWPFARPLPRAAGAWLPSTDVFRDDGHLVVKADLPGMKKADIDIAIEDGDLVLKGERKEETQVEKEDFYRAERAYGSFYRRMALPENVHAENIKAAFDNGVLTVTVPLPKEETKTEHIAIA